MGLERLSNGVTVGAKWSLRRRIGRGGMGEVWLALHTSLQQESDRWLSPAPLSFP